MFIFYAKFSITLVAGKCAFWFRQATFVDMAKRRKSTTTVRLSRSMRFLIRLVSEMWILLFWVKPPLMLNAVLHLPETTTGDQTKALCKWVAIPEVRNFNSAVNPRGDSNCSDSKRTFNSPSTEPTAEIWRRNWRGSPEVVGMEVDLSPTMTPMCWRKCFPADNCWVSWSKWD